MKLLDFFRKPVAPLVERPYPGHPSEYPDDPFERWMDRWKNGGNAVALYSEARRTK